MEFVPVTEDKICVYYNETNFGCLADILFIHNSLPIVYFDSIIRLITTMGITEKNLFKYGITYYVQLWQELTGTVGTQVPQ